MLLGIAVKTNQQWMLYVFVAPLLACILNGTVFSFVSIQWYTPTGHIGLGQAIYSGATGISAPLFTLIFGGLVSLLADFDPNDTSSDGVPGLDTALFAIAGAEAVLSLLLAGFALAGWTQVFNADDYDDVPTLESSTAGELDAAVGSKPAAAVPAAAAMLAPHPRPKMTSGEMAKDLDFWLLVLLYFCFGFAGMGSKGK